MSIEIVFAMIGIVVVSASYYIPDRNRAIALAFWWFGLCMVIAAFIHAIEGV